MFLTISLINRTLSFYCFNHNSMLLLNLYIYIFIIVKVNETDIIHNPILTVLYIKQLYDNYIINGNCFSRQ